MSTQSIARKEIKTVSMTDGGMPENDLRQPPLLTQRALRNHPHNTVGADQSDIVICIEPGDLVAPNDFPIRVTPQAVLHGCITLGFAR